MNKTPNYNLNQWEASDKVQRVDFNADNAKIDAAIASLRNLVGTPLRFASGSYTGTGGGSHSIKTGFAPKFALVVRMDGVEQKLVFFTSGFEFLDENGQVGRLVSGGLARAETDGLLLSGSGDDWRRSVSACNVSGIRYCWCAVG